MHTPKPNAVDYVEIPSRDVLKSQKFFEALFGWKFTSYGPDYVSFEDGRLSGGFFTAQNVSSIATGGALVVFYTDSLEIIYERVAKIGGSITREIFSFPGGRRFHFTEAGGSEFAIWTDK